jgi:hypothetical protein
MKLTWFAFFLVTQALLISSEIRADCPLEPARHSLYELLLRSSPGVLLFAGLVCFLIFKGKRIAYYLITSLCITSALLAYHVPDLLFRVSRTGEFVLTAGCEQKGGQVAFDGPGEHVCSFFCRMPANDGGKVCKDSSDCQGSCVAESKDCDRGEKCSGRCSDWIPTLKPPCGRYVEVVEGNASGSKLCYYN